MQTQKAIAPTAPVAAPLFHRIWPPAIIACALALTAAWVHIADMPIAGAFVGASTGLMVAMLFARRASYRSQKEYRIWIMFRPQLSSHRLLK